MSEQATMARLQNWLEAHHAVESDLEQLGGNIYGIVIYQAYGTTVITTDNICYYPGDAWGQDDPDGVREVAYDVESGTAYEDVAKWLHVISYEFQADQREEFANQYIATVLWSTPNRLFGVDDDASENLDDDYSAEDISPELLVEIQADVTSFLTLYGHLIRMARVGDSKYGQGRYDHTQAAHDFALTRDHHGAGFWDRGLGDIGDELTEVAHSYGSTEWYVGDDGHIYG